MTDSLARHKSPAALILVDVINHFEFPDGQRILREALTIAPRLARLKERARKAGIPCIYVNDNFGQWRSDAAKLVTYCLRPESAGRKFVEPLRVEAEHFRDCIRDAREPLTVPDVAAAIGREAGTNPPVAMQTIYTAMAHLEHAARTGVAEPRWVPRRDRCLARGGSPGRGARVRGTPRRARSSAARSRGGSRLARGCAHRRARHRRPTWHSVGLVSGRS